MVILTFLTSLIAFILIYFAAKVLTDPIHHMIEVIRKVKKGGSTSA
jgi:two-component system NtrC family sensor kinase